LTVPQAADTFVQTSVADSTVTYQAAVKNVSGSFRTVASNGGFSSWNGSSFPYPGVPAKSVTVAAHSSSTMTVGPLPWTAGPASYRWPDLPYSPGCTARMNKLRLLTLTYRIEVSLP
jgi:hypothetical protein